jgi:hypothetical protein
MSIGRRTKGNAPRRVTLTKTREPLPGDGFRSWLWTFHRGGRDRTIGKRVFLPSKRGSQPQGKLPPGRYPDVARTLWVT